MRVQGWNGAYVYEWVKRTPRAEVDTFDMGHLGTSVTA